MSSVNVITMDLSSWADRSRVGNIVPATGNHRDAERLEVNRNHTTARKGGAGGGGGAGISKIPLELEPLSVAPQPKSGQLRGRDTVRDSNARSLSLSPSARQDMSSKRAQYEQANAEYMALVKREKTRKAKDANEAPKRSARLPSLPVLKQSPTAEDRPSARTPPPGQPQASTRASSRTVPDAMAKSAHVSPVPLGGNDDGEVDPGYLSDDEDKGGAGKRPKANRIRVIVRKRPLNEREGGEDCVDCSGKGIHVIATKLRVDLTEYQESHHYEFDDACSDEHSNRDVYEKCGRDLITTVFEGGSASCFAYGQTGSGKTHTMIGNDTEPGLYVLAAEDIFARCQPNHRVFVSLYEIYCNSLFDLLNQRQVLHAREDANRRINICNLTWHEIHNVKDLLRVIDRGTMQRRTGSTSANEFSSRSHAVMTISLRDEEQPKFIGSLNVVDLAGSERAADTAANDKQTRLEGAEINKSLLTLKECIRGLDEGKRHIQFRGSKLTEVLRDSFVGNSRTVMIATVSPSTSNAEHTLNTLRYSFRVKGLSIDCPMPSKERNAPRPTQRSKSTDAELANRRAEKEKEKERKDKEAKERRHKKGHKRRTPRRSAVPESSPDIDKLVEERVAAQVATHVKSAMEEIILQERRRADDALNAMREELRLLRMAQEQGRPSRLPPIEAAAAAAAGEHPAATFGQPSPSAEGGARPRSEKASRRSRRRHSHQHHSAQGSPTKTDHATRTPGAQNLSNSGSGNGVGPQDPVGGKPPNGKENAAGSHSAGLKPGQPPAEDAVTLDDLVL